jgi:hypothetical protein
MGGGDAAEVDARGAFGDVSCGDVCSAGDTAEDCFFFDGASLLNPFLVAKHGRWTLPQSFLRCNSSKSVALGRRGKAAKAETFVIKPQTLIASTMHLIAVTDLIADAVEWGIDTS